VSVDAPEQGGPRHTAPRADRRRPGPPAAAGWRFAYPVVLVGLAVLVLVLSATGARLVLDSRDGQVGRSEQDPAKPGFVESVASTPLLLVVHADDDDNLLGAVVMSLGADDTGGWAVFLSPDTVVPPGGERSVLSQIYADHGIEDLATGEGLRSAVSTLFGADIDSTVPVDATNIATLIEPVAPLEYDNLTPVRVTRGGKTTTVLDDGPVSIRTADEIAAATETLGTGEEPLDRTERQSAFWLAWINAVAAAPDQGFSAGTADTDIARFVTGLASGTHTGALLPTVRYEGALVADTPTLARLLPDIVPYPRQEGVRLTTAVLNGVGDLSRNAPMERRLVAAGAQIATRGNPDAFDVGRTSVVYHDATLADRATALAEAIGATDVRFEEKVDSEIQVTVTIGADFDASEPTTTTTTRSTSTGVPR
jgi:hypothetical protein